VRLSVCPDTNNRSVSPTERLTKIMNRRPKR
jgi:hypothetical protein